MFADDLLETSLWKLLRAHHILHVKTSDYPEEIWQAGTKTEE